MSTLELEHLKHSSASGNNITLAADGSIAVDTTTLKVDATNNRVGIGTASPDMEFHVKGAGTVANFEGTGGSTFIQLKDSDDGTVAFLGADGGSVKVQTSGSSYSDKLVIDTNGAVSKPTQPGFYARHTTARVYTNGYLYDFTLTWEQGGSNLATATGIYTAPASGVYQVNLMLGNQYNSGGGNYKIYVNNTYYNGFTFDGIDNQTGWVTSTLCGLIKINANDTVRIWCNSTGHPDNSDWSAWSMYMVG